MVNVLLPTGVACGEVVSCNHHRQSKPVARAPESYVGCRSGPTNYMLCFPTCSAFLLGPILNKAICLLAET